MMAMATANPPATASPTATTTTPAVAATAGRRRTLGTPTTLVAGTPTAAATAPPILALLLLGRGCPSTPPWASRSRCHHPPSVPQAAQAFLDHAPARHARPAMGRPSTMGCRSLPRSRPTPPCWPLCTASHLGAIRCVLRHHKARWPGSALP
jgi:hypothetical protein